MYIHKFKFLQFLRSYFALLLATSVFNPCCQCYIIYHWNESVKVIYCYYLFIYHILYCYTLHYQCLLKLYLHMQLSCFKVKYLTIYVSFIRCYALWDVVIQMLVNLSILLLYLLNMIVTYLNEKRRCISVNISYIRMKKKYIYIYTHIYT